MSLAAASPDFVVGGRVMVKCQAMKSGLPHELGVLIAGPAGSYEALVDDDLVEVEQHLTGDASSPAKLPATVIKINGVNLLVELPRQVVSGGRRVWIPKSEAQP